MKKIKYVVKGDMVNHHTTSPNTYAEFDTEEEARAYILDLESRDDRDYIHFYTREEEEVPDQNVEG